MQLRRLQSRLVFPDTWLKTGHPFMDLYYDSAKGQWNLGPLFNDRCEFLPSEKHFELQIADIVASMHRRFHLNADRQWRRHSPYSRMKRCRAFARKGQLVKLVFDHPALPARLPGEEEAE